MILTAAPCGVVSSSLKQSVISNGLVFHVDPSNPSCYSGSGSTCNDLTSINGVGTLSNVSFLPDKSFNMNGELSSVYFTRSYTNITNSVTFMVTAEVPTTLSFPIIMSSINAAGGGMVIYIFGVPENFVSAFIAQDSAATSDELVDSISSYPLKKVIGFTINGTVFKFYINGVLISTSSPHTAGNVNAQNLIELGAASEYGGSTEANIKIYNSLIYNRPLSDAEVLFNYNILKSKYNL
jgi:hypothetical protein